MITLKDRIQQNLLKAKGVGVKTAAPILSDKQMADARAIAQKQIQTNTDRGYTPTLDTTKQSSQNMTPLPKTTEPFLNQDRLNQINKVVEPLNKTVGQVIPNLLEYGGKAVGAASGAIGGLVGALTGAMTENFQQTKNLLKGEKYDINKWFDSTIKSAKDTAKFGYETGKGAFQMPALIPQFVGELGKKISETYSEVGTVYEEAKAQGYKNPKLLATYTGLKKSSIEGYKLFGLSEEEAKKLSNSVLGNSIGMFLLYGSAYGIAKGGGKVTSDIYNSIPYVRAKPTGLSVEFPLSQDPVTNQFISKIVADKQFKVKVSDGNVEIFINKKFTPEQVKTITNKIQSTLKGNISYEQYKLTTMGRLGAPIGTPSKGVVGTYYPERMGMPEQGVPTSQTPVVQSNLPGQPTQRITPTNITRGLPVVRDFSGTQTTPAQITPAQSIQRTTPQTPVSGQPSFEMIPQTQVENINRVKKTLQELKQAKVDLETSGRGGKEIKNQVALIDRMIVNLDKQLQQPAKGTVLGPEVKKQTTQEVKQTSQIKSETKKIENKKEEGFELLERVKNAGTQLTNELKEKTLKGLRENQRLDTEEKIAKLIQKDYKPTDSITVYRAGKGTIKNGDQITVDKKNAERYISLRNNVVLLEKKVKIKDLVRNEGLKTEFIYNPKKETKPTIEKKKVGRPSTGQGVLEAKALKEKRELKQKAKLEKEKSQRLDKQIEEARKQAEVSRQIEVQQKLEQEKKFKSGGEIKIYKEEKIGDQIVKRELTQKEIDEIEQSQMSSSQKRLEATKETAVEKFKKELEVVYKNGATQDDLWKMYQEAFDKEIEGDVDGIQSATILEFIEEKFGYDKEIQLSNQEGKISIKLLLDPIKPLETFLNRGFEKGVKYAYQHTGAKNLVESLKVSLQRFRWFNKLGKTFIYRYGQPQWYKDLKDLTESKKIQAETLAQDVMDNLSKGLTDTQKVDLHGAIINFGHHTNPDIAARAQFARQLLDDYGDRYWKSGAISKETYEANKGTYLPRLYYKYEQPAEVEFSSSAQKANLDRTLQRGMTKRVSENTVEDWVKKGWEVRGKPKNGKVEIWRDYTKEEKQKMGEIVQAPEYVVAKGIKQVGMDTAMLEMLKEVSMHPDVVSDEQIGDFRQLPTDKRYGALSGKWIDPYLYEDIHGIVNFKEQGTKMANKILSEWKTWKVVDNPAAHFRNMYWNFILSDIAGLSLTRVDVYGSALVDVIKKEGDYKEARNGGLFGSTWSGEELSSLLDAKDRKILNLKPNEKGMYVYDFKAMFGDNITNVFSKLKLIYQKTQGKISSIYQAEEEWNKMALYKYAKYDLGLDVKDSVNFAKKWGLDYKAVPPAIANFSQKWYGVPFLRFQYKALPTLVESFVTRPFTLLKWFLILLAFEETARKTVNITRQELNKIKSKVFPDWMKTGLYILAPQKSEDDTYQFLDLTYIIPFIEDIKQFDPKKYIFNNPLSKLPYEVILNRSAFTGEDIVKDKELYSNWVYVKLMMKYIYEQLSPPIIPGGYNFKSIWDSTMGNLTTGEKQKKYLDANGRLKELLPTIGSAVFGLKFRAINVTDEQKWRIIELKKKDKDIRSKMMSIMSDKGKTDAQKKQEIDSFRIKLQEIYQKAAEIGSSTSYLDQYKRLLED